MIKTNQAESEKSYGGDAETALEEHYINVIDKPM